MQLAEEPLLNREEMLRMSSWLKKTPMAFYNVLQFPMRTTVSAAGIAFALLLVFMQLGFLGAVSNTATVLLNQLEFDLVVRSPDYLHLYEPRHFDQSWIAWCRGQADVMEVKPLWLDLVRWQNPQDKRVRAIALIGLRVDQIPFLPETNPEANTERRQKLNELLNSRQLLIDTASRGDFGPRNGRRFTEADIGQEVMVGNERIRIAGLLHIGTGLAANGQAVVSQSAFAKLVPWDASRRTNMGLIRLRPGSNPETVARQLNALLRTNGRDAAMVEVLTRQEVIARETQRWIAQTPIGIIFQMGVVLALMVGATVVYQVLSTDIANRMPEYATLKAMGFSNGYLSNVVLFQAWYLALLSFIPAWILAELLYRFTSWFAGIPITMTVSRIVMVALAGLIICTCSGAIALSKLRRAEPASLF
jgi:putative ABC transport system permease protein